MVVIDEIGKMELYSHRFQQVVRQLIGRKDLTILATIPNKRGVPIPFVEEVRSSPTVRVFEVSTLTELPTLCSSIPCQHSSLTDVVSLNVLTYV